MTDRSLLSAVRRVVSAVVEDAGEIWSNRRAARHIGRMTVDMGLRRRTSGGKRDPDQRSD